MQGEQVMDYPAAVIEKAQQTERLLQRVADGEPLAVVCAELGMAVAAAELAKLQARYAAGGGGWEALLDGRFGHCQTITLAMREWLYARKRQDETLTAPLLAVQLTQEFGVAVSAGHVNHLLRKVGLTRLPGRPFKRLPGRPPAAPAAASPSLPEPALANAGLFFPGGRAARDGGRDRRDADGGHGD
jgi:hypothetical protein